MVQDRYISFPCHSEATPKNLTAYGTTILHASKRLFTTFRVTGMTATLSYRQSEANAGIRHIQHYRPRRSLTLDRGDTLSSRCHSEATPKSLLPYDAIHAHLTKRLFTTFRVTGMTATLSYRQSKANAGIRHIQHYRPRCSLTLDRGDTMPHQFTIHLYNTYRKAHAR
jgi:hypothetical protein